jgi:hypothetical protein
MALGFSLALVAIFSLVVVAAIPRDALNLTIDRTRARSFRGGNVSAFLNAGARTGRTLVRMEIVTVPKGLDATLEGDGSRRVLNATSRFAGVYRGLVVKAGVGDPMGLFVRYRTHDLEFTMEFLPTFLLSKNEPMVVAAAMLGDLPAGRSGTGQEFYSAEVYNTSSNSKDIMWKREAKFPSDRLYVRVGEANIPETLTVCLVERNDLNERTTPVWMDLVSEAIARMGMQVVAAGTTFRLIHDLGGDARVIEAKDVAALANAIVWLWRADAGGVKTMEGPMDADIVVAGQIETQDPKVLGIVLDKPSVILAWGKRNPVGGTNVAFFTGREDFSGLVAMVLSR